MFLAALNDDHICIGVKQTKDMIDDSKHVVIDSLDSYYLYRKYENGKWSEDKFLPKEGNEQKHQPDSKDMQEQTYLNTEYLVTMSELQNL